MPGPLDSLPSVEGPFGVTEGIAVIEAAFRTMVPDGHLCDHWQEFSGMVLRWVGREEPIFQETLANIRTSLEQICGDDLTGELLIASAKMGISSVMIACPNPYYIVLDERNPIHDDVGVLVEKGVVMLHAARDQEPFDPTVRVDFEIAKRLEERAQETREVIRKDWLSELMARAVRPGRQN